MFKKLSITTAGGIGFLLVPFLALANVSTVTGLVELVTRVVTWFESIVFSVAIIMILVAAFQFLTAAGNEEKVGTARKSLIWGLVGIAVALFARLANSFVSSILFGR
ncbi:MAG: hypothetical protein Q7S34_00230 [bacterium]|nr:hypothetical protein [bacterium]